MPHTEIAPAYVVEFTHAEFRLVTLALAGKLDDAKDVEAALKLNVHLCHQRLHNLKQITEVAAHALENSKKLVPANPGGDATEKHNEPTSSS